MNKTNLLFITLGTRDLQLDPTILNVLQKGDKEFELSISDLNPQNDSYLLKSPRKGAEIILKNLNLFRPYIKFPILEEVWQSTPDSVKLTIIYTDQSEQEHRNKDTLYYAKILKEILSTSYSEISLLGIYDNVTDVDQQYLDLKIKLSHYPGIEEVEKVYLFPQGGIDGINQALTLRLIEKYRTKVIHLHKKEDGELRDSVFPSAFIQTLNRENAKNALLQYDFHFVAQSFSKYAYIKNLANYAHYCLLLDYGNAKNNLKHLPTEECFLPSTDFQKLQDLYISAKISLQQKKPNDFLWKMFTLNELLLKEELLPFLDKKEMKYHTSSRPTPWERALQYRYPDAIPYLQECKFHDVPLKFEFASRHSFKALFQYFLNCGKISLERKYLLGISDDLESLSTIRHGVAHELRSTTRNEIDTELKNKGSSLERLLSQLDSHFNINKMGRFDKYAKILQEEIDKL